MDKIVIYDTETTNSTIWGSIIEVGAVVCDKNLNEISKSIALKHKRDVKISSEKINIKIVKKYLFISLKSKLILVNISLFIKIFLGLLNDKI